MQVRIESEQDTIFWTHQERIATEYCLWICQLLWIDIVDGLIVCIYCMWLWYLLYIVFSYIGCNFMNANTVC